MKTCTTRAKKTANRKRARGKLSTVTHYWERPSTERPEGVNWTGRYADFHDFMQQFVKADPNDYRPDIIIIDDLEDFTQQKEPTD